MTPQGEAGQPPARRAPWWAGGKQKRRVKVAFNPTPRIAPVRVMAGELIGFDWVEGKKHQCAIKLDEAACAMLTQKLNAMRAYVVKLITPPWNHYNNLVFWPGVGAFAVRLEMRR